MVCSYFSVVCLIEFSSSFKLNEIYMVDSPFNEDLRNFFRQVLVWERDGRKSQGSGQ